MKRAAAYIRVSTDQQRTGLEAQKRSIDEHLANKNVNVVFFSDEGISGTKSSRPGLNAMMDALRAGTFDAVVVYSFSRFARSTRHLLDALEELGRLGVAFISLTEQVDTSTPMGKAMFTIISAISQLERDLIAERVKNGLRNARAKGKILGRKKTRPSELIRALRDQGLSYREIAKLAKCSHGAICEELREARSEKVSSMPYRASG